MNEQKPSLFEVMKSKEPLSTQATVITAICGGITGLLIALQFV